MRAFGAKPADAPAFNAAATRPVAEARQETGSIADGYMI
jgi:hypothetical protein